MPRDKMLELLKQLATSPRSPLNGIVARLAEIPREQLIELINQQLRAMAPASAPIQPPAGPRFHLIPIPQVCSPAHAADRRRRSTREKHRTVAEVACGTWARPSRPSTSAWDPLEVRGARSDAWSLQAS
jgi:hypothetical protein